jgi:hypothetical protein
MENLQVCKWIAMRLLLIENTTVTPYQGNAIGEKRPGSAIYFHGPGKISFSLVSSP